MTGEPFRTNLRWVLDAFTRWPRATTIGFVIVSVGIGSAALIVDPMGYGPFDAIFTVVAVLLELAFMKIMFLLMLYPLMYRAPFPGTFVGASFITMVIGCAGIAIDAAVRPLPGVDKSILIALVPILYIVGSLFFGWSLQANYLFHRDRRVPWRRLDEG